MNPIIAANGVTATLGFIGENWLVVGIIAGVGTLSFIYWWLKK